MTLKSGTEFSIMQSYQASQHCETISHFKDSQKDAKLKVEKINDEENICARKRKLDDLHQRIHVLSYDSVKTDILSFFCGMSDNVAI